MSEHITTPRLLKAFEARKAHFYRKRKYAAQFEEAGYSDVAQKLRDCQETEVLACCSDCGHTWYVISRCRLRVCPLCSYEKSKERAAFMHLITKQMAFPKMLTLTMPLWTDKAQLGIMYLRQCFSKLRRSKVFRSVTGGCYQIEVKIKETGYHIHLHAIIDAPYIPRQHIYSRWCEILGRDQLQVDIRAATEEKQKEYVCKYAAKAADFDKNTSVIVEWYEATKGARLFSTFGKWYNVKLEQLNPLAEPEQKKPPCPRCGAIGATFLARDGPFIYGGDTWRSVEIAIVGDRPESQRLHEICDVLDGKRSIEEVVPEETDTEKESHK